MGGDGGCCPQRADIVQTRGYTLAPNRGYGGGMSSNANTFVRNQAAPAKEPEFRKKWMTMCWLTNEKLRDPVVSCPAGFLYNKDALIRGLIKKNLSDGCRHIHSMKQLIDVQRTIKDDHPVCQITQDSLLSGSAKAHILFSDNSHKKGTLISDCGLKILEGTKPQSLELFTHSDPGEFETYLENNAKTKKRKIEPVTVVNNQTVLLDKTIYEDRWEPKALKVEKEFSRKWKRMQKKESYKTLFQESDGPRALLGRGAQNIVE